MQYLSTSVVRGVVRCGVSGVGKLITGCPSGWTRLPQRLAGACWVILHRPLLVGCATPSPPNISRTLSALPTHRHVRQ